jgi:hypothetical protein
LVETYAETRNYALLGIVLIVAIIAVGVNSNPVLAQACTAQLGYPQMAAPQYYGSNVQVTVPVSASCSIYTNQLYAVGTAYTGYNSNLGTANAVLTATYSNSFSGQLQFNLPTSVQTVQFSVSIYNAQSGYYQQYYGGQPLAVASETYMVNSNNYQSGYPSYPTYPSYPSYPSNPSYPSCPSYPSYPSYGSYSSCSNYSSYPNYNPNQGGYYYYNGGYYNYYHNGGYHNNYTPHCNNWNWNSCNHH